MEALLSIKKELDVVEPCGCDVVAARDASGSVLDMLIGGLRTATVRTPQIVIHRDGDEVHAVWGVRVVELAKRRT